jgi:hypothetical protein
VAIRLSRDVDRSYSRVLSVASGRFGSGGLTHGSSVCVFSANVHVGSLRAVWFGSTEDFTSDRPHLPDPEGEEAEQVDRRMSFGPLKVDVRLPSGVVTQVQQQGCQRIGNGRAFHFQHPMTLVRDVACDLTWLTSGRFGLEVVLG